MKIGKKTKNQTASGSARENSRFGSVSVFQCQTAQVAQTALAHCALLLGLVAVGSLVRRKADRLRVGSGSSRLLTAYISGYIRTNSSHHSSHHYPLWDAIRRLPQLALPVLITVSF